MTTQPSWDDELVYMLRHSHLSANSLRDLEREIADRELLKNARQQHQRVQDAAVSASQNYEIEEENKRIEELAKQERRRVKLAEQRIKEQAELERLKAVPTPTPAPKQSPPTPQAPQLPRTPTKSVAIQCDLPRPPNVDSIPPPPATQPPPQPPPPTWPPQPVTQVPKKVTFAAPSQPTQPVAPIQTAPRPQKSTSHIHPDADRYVQIHQELKKLRHHVKVEVPKQYPNFWKDAGDFRRQIRKTVGQIRATKVTGANKDQMNAIVATLKQAKDYTNGPTCDPSPFLVRPPPPVQGASDQLTIMFLYIMNIFVKCIIAQFAKEAGIKPAAADPIGTIAVSIIARTVHLWRGVSLIDMMIAKFRVTCPVLFGFRGNEKTEQGRQRLGWMRDEGGWVDDQTHTDRMTGLGAGFAAISLRDFSKVASMKNPYPPTNYWWAMAALVSTPPAEVSNTQFLVLKAMIDGYEMRFLTFYGSAARAALKVAVVDFPARAPEQNSAVTSLSFLERKIREELGLRLV